MTSENKAEHRGLLFISVDSVNYFVTERREEQAERQRGAKKDPQERKSKQKKEVQSTASKRHRVITRQ